MPSSSFDTVTKRLCLNLYGIIKISSSFEWLQITTLRQLYKTESRRYWLLIWLVARGRILSFSAFQKKKKIRKVEKFCLRLQAPSMIKSDFCATVKLSENLPSFVSHSLSLFSQTYKGDLLDRKNYSISNTFVGWLFWHSIVLLIMNLPSGCSQVAMPTGRLFCSVLIT